MAPVGTTDPVCFRPEYVADGVCDDETNTEICKYDGKDCCMEDKSVKTCQDCTCYLKVDKSELKTTMTVYDVHMYLSVDIDSKTFSIVMRVSHVFDEDICSKLCLDAQTRPGYQDIDAWVYEHNHVDKLCTCMTFEHCYNQTYFQPLESNDITKADDNSTLRYYVMTKDLDNIDCGREY